MGFSTEDVFSMMNGAYQSGEHEIPKYWPGNCFVCSRSNPAGLKLKIYMDGKGCLARCRLSDHLCGFEKIAHGGIISTIIDEISAWTIITQEAMLGVTSDMAVRYIRPVYLNTDIVFKGRIIDYSDERAKVITTVRSFDDTLLAEGKSRFVFPKLSDLARLGNMNVSVLEEFLSVYKKKDN